MAVAFLVDPDGPVLTWSCMVAVTEGVCVSSVSVEDITVLLSWILLVVPLVVVDTG